MKTSLWVATCGLAIASPAPAQTPGCESRVDRRALVACVLANSPALDEASALERAADGRREAARPFLPANPVVSGSVASRVGPTDTAINWSVTLAQELEVAGQRGLRVDAAEAELEAARSRFTIARREVLARAWNAYFSALALQERVALAGRLETAATEVAATVRAMAKGGLASELDAEVADAAALRVSHDRLLRTAALATARATLLRLTGAAPAATIAGALEPLATTTPPAAQALPEVRALEQQRLAAEQQAAAVSRERVPNPTVSLFAQNDGFQERVLGVGLSLPIPLPHPVGRTKAGALAEARANAERARSGAELGLRTAELERATALAELEAATLARGLYGPERATHAAQRLEQVVAQVRTGRLPVRDALLAQQALVDLLESELDARETLCLASVRAARLDGAALEGVSP